MLFPGIKKVRDKFNLSDDGKFVKGTVRNSRVRLCDGRNCKILTVSAPAEISDQTREALQKFSQKPYKAKVQVDTKSVTFTFVEILWPYSWEKICQVLDGAAQIFFDANPNLPAPEAEPEEAASEGRAVNVNFYLRLAGIAIVAAFLPLMLKEWKSIKTAEDCARSIAAECPVQLDEWTSLDSASSSWHKVILNYTITGHENLLDDAQQIIKENFIQSLKSDGSNEYLYERTVWFILNYNDVDGSQLFQIKIVPIDYKPENAK